jgi:hypothetical protein
MASYYASFSSGSTIESLEIRMSDLTQQLGQKDRELDQQIGEFIE